MRSCNAFDAVVAEADGDYAVVTLRATSRCGGCKACQIGRANEKTRLKAVNAAGANVGDEVEVEIVHAPWLATAILVIFPLLAFVCGVIAGTSANVGELASFGIAAGLTAVAFVGALAFDRLVLAKRYAPRITAKVEKANAEENETNYEG